jgi:hypothetical protein
MGGLTAEKMKDCRWLRPALVGQFEFVEWTPDNHLRHSKFIALREDRDAWSVGREQSRVKSLRDAPARLAPYLFDPRTEGALLAINALQQTNSITRFLEKPNNLHTVGSSAVLRSRNRHRRGVCGRRRYSFGAMSGRPGSFGAGIVSP